MPTTAEYLTIIATTRADGVSAADMLRLEEDVRAVLERHGLELVPTGWSPDCDTVADNLGREDVEHLDLAVLDLNPGLAATCGGCGSTIGYHHGCWQDGDGYACPAVTDGDDRHVPARKLSQPAGTVGE